MYSGTGKIWALDINKGRLRILMDAAKLHGLDDMIVDIHADLRLYAVSSHESSHKPRKRTEDLLITLQWKYFRNMTSDHHGFMFNDLSTYMIRKFCPCGHILQKETTAKYDKVLLDAPCSGLGVLPKVPFFIKYISNISSFQFSFKPIWIWSYKLLHYKITFF